MVQRLLFCLALGMAILFPTAAGAVTYTTPIQHIIVVIQENRTVDNMFNGFPGADTVRYGYNSSGAVVALTTRAIATPWDLGHHHTSAFVPECAASPSTGRGGACTMRGFDLEPCNAGSCPTNFAYMYVDPAYTGPYWAVAFEGSFSDENFSTQQGPSSPSHQYAFAGTSATTATSHLNDSDNPPGNPGCNWAASTKTIDMTQAWPGTESSGYFPCNNISTMGDLLDANSISWKQYQHNQNPSGSDAALWDSCAQFVDCCGTVVGNNCTGSEYTSHVSAPESGILSDISGGTLPNVSWVIPISNNSDHPDTTTNHGPNWIAGIVNAVGNSSTYWPNTAVCVVWDDWGGFYDHVPPPPPAGSPNDPYEYGFRVPLMCISAYSNRGLVDHTPRDSTSILHFMETSFGLAGPINAASVELLHDNLAPMFNFSQLPLTFVPIALNGN